jgi:hypothetical protein
MMAVLLKARAELRQRWRSWLALAALVAVGGGAAIALAAGARRTASAYTRFVHAERAADVVAYADPPRALQVQALPEVADSATGFGFPTTEGDLAVGVLTDARLGRQINRFKFLAGRPPNPGRADEAVVGFLTAQSRHLRVGSSLTILVRPSQQAVTFRVVGVEAAPGEFPPQSTSGNLVVYLSPAFLHTRLGTELRSAEGVTEEIAIRLRHGPGDTGAFVKDLTRMPGKPVGVTVMADQSANVKRSMRLQATALWLMAGAATLALALLLWQLLSRQGAEGSTDHPIFRALGMTPGQLLGSEMVQVWP